MTLEAHQAQQRIDALELQLATIRATATRSVPNCINLEAIDRIIKA